MSDVRQIIRESISASGALPLDVQQLSAAVHGVQSRIHQLEEVLRECVVALEGSLRTVDIYCTSRQQGCLPQEGSPRQMWGDALTKAKAVLEGKS